MAIADKPVEMTKEQFSEFLKEGLLASLQKQTFVLHYRAKFKPDSCYIIAKDLKDARERGYAYCQRWKMKFISVQPFYLDLTKSPEDNSIRSALNTDTGSTTIEEKK